MAKIYLSFVECIYITVLENKTSHALLSIYNVLKDKHLAHALTSRSLPDNWPLHPTETNTLRQTVAVQTVPSSSPSTSSSQFVFADEPLW